MNDLYLASQLARGACPDCSRTRRVVFHGVDSRCPFRVRSRPVPCRGATLAESRDGRHFTWNDDAVCSACRSRMGAAQERARALLAPEGAG